MEITREKLSTAAAVALLPVRLVQLGSVVITGYILCYLVFMHHNHYCSWYNCGSGHPESTAVPIGEVLFIIASIIVTLEWMLFGGILAFQAKAGKAAPLSSTTQFTCACFALFVYSIGFVAFASIPTVRATWPYCYNMWSNSVYDPPEKYFCITTQNAVSCGLISWVVTMLVALLGVLELRKDYGVGVIRLSDEIERNGSHNALSIGEVHVDTNP